MVVLKRALYHLRLHTIIVLNLKNRGCAIENEQNKYQYRMQSVITHTEYYTEVIRTLY